MDDPDRRLELLDFVDQQGDVPRYGYTSRWGQQVIKAWVQRGGFGTVTEIVGWAHLSCLELAAGAILLGVMTGQNRSVILDTPKLTIARTVTSQRPRLSRSWTRTSHAAASAHT